MFTSLLADSVGDIAARTSPLPTGADAGLFVDYLFLLSQIACAVQHARGSTCVLDVLDGSSTASRSPAP